jgi:hypothetical protein
MQPLHAASHSFQWGDEQQSAFEWLKQRITGRDIGLLHFLDYGTRDIHVAVDASEDGAGGVLYQLDTDGKMQIAAFASRAFNQTERKWSTLEQECYALLHCATKLETCIRTATPSLVTRPFLAPDMGLAHVALLNRSLARHVRILLVSAASCIIDRGCCGL